MAVNSYDAQLNIRKYLRARLTKIGNQLTDNMPNLSQARLLDLRDQVKQLSEDLNDSNRQINALSPETVNIEDMIQREDEYRENVRLCLEVIKNNIIVPPPNPRPEPSNIIAPSMNRLKLPMIELPTFSNDKDDNLEKFFFAFESIINKHSLTNYEKFIYLKNQVKKGPEALLNSLEPTNQTYDHAKQLLTDAFASPLTQQYDAIKKLSELRLGAGDEVYSYVGNMRSIQSSFENLNIDIGTVIQYFVWQGLNKKFQDQLVQITNTTKPTLQQINTNMFTAAERYLKMKEIEDKYRYYDKSNRSYTPSTPVAPITNNLGINVNSKSVRPCVLCTADKIANIVHDTRTCTIYPTPFDKVKKLKSLNFCAKCSFTNHDTSNCKFKFHSPCKECKKPHMTYLCLKTNNNDRKTYSNVSTVTFNNTVMNDSVFLPSYTLNIRNNGLDNLARTLYDTGSQRNFVSEKFSNQMKLECVEENVNLRIKGFHVVRHMITKCVKLPIDIEGFVGEIKAIVVPDIAIEFKINNLEKITREFKRRGYSIADLCLGDSDTVGGFDLVMGPDAVRILSPQSVVFGSDPTSAFFETEIGILLLGETYDLIRNLRDIPERKVHVQKETEVEIYSSVVNEIMTERGEINSAKLKLATDEALETYTEQYFNYDNPNDKETSEVNKELVDYILENTDRTPEGRLIMPLPWNPACKHQLGKNYFLAKKILQHNLTKLQKNDKLTMYDDVFKEQESMGVIERIEDTEKFLNENPDHSFLAHMGIFKPDRDTTKCRIVYLSNLCERNSEKITVSHNNALLPGPCINTKLSIAFLLSRFDKFICIFDIAKAFLGIQLREIDQNALLCWWFKDVEKGDFSPIIYRNLRLSFGLRPSPTILMLGLYKILIQDIENDDTETIAFKKQIFNNFYMDNGLISSNDTEQLHKYYTALPSIFGAYKFNLQQFASNSLELQMKIDTDHDCTTESPLKYFGMEWDRENDTIGPFKINLDHEANTKRLILSNLNAVYDLTNVILPILNRAKLFLHKLQVDHKIEWDSILNEEQLSEWRNICKQCNSSPAIKVERLIGSREGNFTLVAFSDASASIYGTVIYIIENNTRRISFLSAKNKIVSTKMSKKSIPSLECQGVVLAAETLIEIYNELCSSKTVSPISVTGMYVYTDSMVVISWIRGYFLNHSKMQKRSIFIMNRLKQLGDLCNTMPITFRFIEGNDNPSDCVTRPLSYRTLSNSCYFKGPEFLKELPSQPDLEITIPNSNCSSYANTVNSCESQTLKSDSVSVSNQPHSHGRDRDEATNTGLEIGEHVIDLDCRSSFRKIVNIQVYVMKFIEKLRAKVELRKGLSGLSNSMTQTNRRLRASDMLIRLDQTTYFPEILQYFQKSNTPKYKIPNLVLQLNLYMDDSQIVRVKGKFGNNNHPALLSNNSRLAELMVNDLHITFAHSGVYTVLKELRRKVWILRGFSTVRRLLRTCVNCKKMNASPIKLSQNSYREFRDSPSRTPFGNVFLDYIGPVNIRSGGEIQKTWILIVTCLYTRAVSLQICFSADTTEFLRCLQIHIYRYGMFSVCLSDLGSQITSGTRIITEHLKDTETVKYFNEHNIHALTFDQYAKGNSTLGSLVETLVKQVKYLIIKSIGKIILTYTDFQLLVSKTDSIINRRPLCFKETLRESMIQEDLPEPITPEQLIYGRELLSLNIIPTLQPDFGDNFMELSVGNARTEFFKLQSVMKNLNNLYHEEFIQQLMSQAIDKKDRYKPVSHKLINPGDIVLLVEPQTKRSNYPMAIVKSVEVNSLGEVTSAFCMKGKNRETVYRHATSIIPILTVDEVYADGDDEANRVESPPDATNAARPRRNAAVTARDKISLQIGNNLV